MQVVIVLTIVHDAVFWFGIEDMSYLDLQMQYEGGVMEGGKGPSIWDTFTHQHPGMLKLNLCFAPQHSD